MPTYSITGGAFGTARVTGTRPFTKLQTGGENGAVRLVNADGTDAKVTIGAETANSVFAETTGGQAKLDGIITAANNSPANTVAPAITGTATVGQQLTTTGGTFTGTPAATKTYQWNRDGVAISGATAANYTLVSADQGKVITVTVAGTNTHGSVTVTSAPTAAVAAA